MSIEALRIYQSPFEKIRIGRNKDGGYVICVLENVKYDALISGGINDDVSFENAFVQMYDVPAYAFDHTIDKLPSDASKGILWYKKMIGEFENEEQTNLIPLLKQYHNCFVKLDIEKGEYPLLKALVDTTYINNVAQFVIEFHYPYFHKPSAMELIKRLTSTHTMFHMHGNNFAGKSSTLNYQGVCVPKIFEVTLVRNSEVKDCLIPNTDSIPSALDRPNASDKNDIELNYYPFCTI